MHTPATAENKIVTQFVGPVFQSILTPAADPGPRKCRHVAHNTHLLKAF